MLFFWGSGGDHKDLGHLGNEMCDRCGTVRPMKLVLLYRYAHFWFFYWLTSKQYFKACDVCSSGVELDAAKVEEALEASPVPWWHRRSWMILVGFIVIDDSHDAPVMLEEEDAPMQHERPATGVKHT